MAQNPCECPKCAPVSIKPQKLLTNITMGSPLKGNKIEKTSNTPRIY